MRYLLVPVADDENLFRETVWSLTASGQFGPICEVTVDVFDSELIQHIKAVHQVQEARNGREDDE
jgi:hypothetical protein